MSECQQLAKLIEQGLRPGTVLAEFAHGNEWHFVWNGSTVVYADNEASYDDNPLDPDRKWRIVSTPPKKITFELKDGFSRVMGVDSLCLPHDHPFVEEAPLIVTVEEKR